MMDFLDRNTELDRLNHTLKLSGALVVVWGRRRVGKTCLLLEWSKKNNGVYIVADQSSPQIQRTYCSQALDLQFPGFSSVEYPTWDALLQRLARDAKGQSWKGPVIFDELPYFVQSSPELPSVLQRWIDHEAKEAGLLVVIAGSSQRMMQGLVLDQSAPLYGRASELLNLQPLAAGYLRKGFPKCDPVTLVEFYALAGGLPRYWQLISDTRLSEPAEIVDHLVLDPNGPLHHEPDRLLLEETPPAISLRPILDAIGQGAHRASEIAGRMGAEATSLSRSLTRLQEMGLIAREVPFGDSEKSSKRALYRISDPFLRLWFRVVAPHRALLASAPKQVRLSLYEKHRSQLLGAAWEELCRRSVTGLQELDKKKTQNCWMPAQRYWRGADPEWDIVAESIDNKEILLGESKWFGKTLKKNEIERICLSIVSRRAPPAVAGSGKIPRFALFVPQGESTSSEISPTVKIYSAADVFACLL
jgi:AAA+ ATPase superfamily predicted ATPase